MDGVINRIYDTCDINNRSNNQDREEIDLINKLKDLLDEEGINYLNNIINLISAADDDESRVCYKQGFKDGFELYKELNLID